MAVVAAVLLLIAGPGTRLDWWDFRFGFVLMRWAVYFMVMTRHCDRKTTGAICDRFEMPPRHRKLICEHRFDADRCLYWLQRHQPVANNALYRRLSEFKTEPLLYMMAISRKKTIKRAISIYFTKLRFIRPAIRGRDLMALGLAPGPVYRKILDAVLDARLNGRLRTLEEETEFARAFIQKDGSP